MTNEHTLLFQSFDMRFFCLVVWLIGWVLGVWLAACLRGTADELCMFVDFNSEDNS